MGLDHVWVVLVRLRRLSRLGPGLLGRRAPLLAVAHACRRWIHGCMAISTASVVHFLLVVAVLLKIDVAGVGRRRHLRFTDIVHILLQGILYFAFALPAIVARLNL